MDQYGSPQYGLYSGYIKPGIAYLRQNLGRTPIGLREQIPRMEQESIQSIVGSAQPFGNISNPDNIRSAIDILSKFGVKHRNIRIMGRNIKKMMEIVHPDKFRDQPAKIPAATQAFQELNWAKDVIEANKGSLRVYGIF